MISPERFDDGREMLMAGLAERFTTQTRGKIPALWARFAPFIGKVPGQVGPASYGISWNIDAEFSFDYLAAVEVADPAGLPQEFSTLRIAPQRYAVFHHLAHVSTIAATLGAICESWLPNSGFEPCGPCIERYDHRFDPHTGMGGFEIWLPIQSSH